MSTPKDEPEKFSAISARYIARHLPAFKTHLYQIWGKIIGLKFERIFQDFHWKSPEEM